MDAQHQKTNKSAQFACYLREHTYIIEYYIRHLSFRAAVPPLIHLFPLYSAFKQDYPGKQASNKERAKVFGDDFFLLFFWSRKQKDTTRTTYIPTCLTLSRTSDCEPPNRELRDLETKPLCVITQKWSMHAIICDIQFAHGVNLPIFLVTLFFSFLFFLFVFSFYLFLFAHISKCPRHG